MRLWERGSENKALGMRFGKQGSENETTYISTRNEWGYTVGQIGLGVAV